MTRALPNQCRTCAEFHRDYNPGIDVCRSLHNFRPRGPREGLFGPFPIRKPEDGCEHWEAKR
jgi:hypothetical protein